MRYAMVNNNNVIEVLNSQIIKPKWPCCPDGSQVIAIECDETVKIGMVYNPEIDKFIENIHPIENYVPSQLDRIESMILKSQEQIAQEARDAYTLELINSGII